MCLGLGITLDYMITWCQKVRINSESNPHTMAGAFTHTQMGVCARSCVCVCDAALNMCQHVRNNNNKENTLM